MQPVLPAGGPRAGAVHWLLGAVVPHSAPSALTGMSGSSLLLSLAVTDVHARVLRNTVIDQQAGPQPQHATSLVQASDKKAHPTVPRSQRIRSTTHSQSVHAFTFAHTPVHKHTYNQGYILYSMRKKLKPELVGRSQEEVKQLRLSGQEVTDTYQVCVWWL